MGLLIPLRAVMLYDEGTEPALSVSTLAGYLRSKVPGLRADSKGEFFSEHLKALNAHEREKRIEELALRLARTRMTAPPQQEPAEPLPAEVDYERRRLENPKGKGAGILYDGFELQSVYFSALKRNQMEAGCLHVVFTERLFGTIDESDMRPHARAAVYGPLALVSTTGIVEAPARPRDFYLMLNEMERLGRGELGKFEAKRAFAGQFIDYGDARLTEVAKGYLMQAVVYTATGEAFCNDGSCRLFNAHWQEELIRSQLGPGQEFCQRHEQVLKDISQVATSGRAGKRR